LLPKLERKWSVFPRKVFWLTFALELPSQIEVGLCLGIVPS
jgi:hypothetical protein